MFLNRTDVVARIAKEQNMTKKSSEELVCLIIDTIKSALEEGDKVQITGFGTFEVKDRAPRVGRNPKTNEEVEIPASRRPVFRPSAQLKELINRK